MTGAGVVDLTSDVSDGEASEPAQKMGSQSLVGSDPDSEWEFQQPAPPLRQGARRQAFDPAPNSFEAAPLQVIMRSSCSLRRCMLVAIIHAVLL